MRQVLVILFVFNLHSVYAQPSYTRFIDSTVNYIDKRGVFYSSDSTHSEFDKDSNVTRADTIRLIYADTKAKKLLKVDEFRSNRHDTTHLVYYFADKKLVKVKASLFLKNRQVVQSFYFKNNRLVFPDNYFEEIFKVNDYIEQAKDYLKMRNKNLSLNMTDDNEPN